MAIRSNDLRATKTKPKKPELRFEALADIDVDSAVFMVGLQHFPIGPARPAMRFETGAVNVGIEVHYGDLDAMIDALKEAKRKLKAAGWGK